MATNTADLIITGTDKTGKAFSGVDKKLKSTQKRTKALNLGMAKLTKGFGSMGGGLASLLGPLGLASIGVLGLSAAIGKSIKSSIEYGDRLGKVSKTLGISSESLQFYEQSLSLAGVSSETFATSLDNMRRVVGDTKAGIGRAQQAFSTLGISMEDLANLSADKQFDLITEALNGIDNEADRASLAYKIFGTSATQLTKILGINSASFAKNKADVKANSTFLSNEATASYEAAADNLTILGQGFTSMGNTARNIAAPAILQLTSALTKILGLSPVQIVVEVIGGDELAALSLSMVKSREERLRKDEKTTLAAIAEFEGRVKRGTIFFDLPELDKARTLLKEIREEQARIAPTSLLRFSEDRDAENMRAVSSDIINPKSFEELSAANAIALEDVESLLDGYLALATTGVEPMALLERATIANSKAMVDSAARLQELKERHSELGEEVERLNQDREQGDTDEIAMDKLIDTAQKEQLQNQQDQIKLNETIMKQRDAQAEQVAKAIELQKELNTAEVESSLSFEVAAEAGGILFRSLNDGIGQFLDGSATMSEAFKDMSLGFLKDIAQMIIQFAILNAAAMLFNALSGGSAAIAGTFSNTLAKSFGLETFLPKTHQASGGQVSVGQSLIVGESGREMFTPAVNGTITPSNKMGGEVVINNSIQIINQSGTPLQGTVSTEQRGDDEVTLVVLKDLRGSGAISTAIQQRFNLKSTPR